MVCKLNFVVFTVVDLVISEAEVKWIYSTILIIIIVKVPSIEKMETEVEFFEEHGLPLNYLS